MPNLVVSAAILMAVLSFGNFAAVYWSRVDDAAHSRFESGANTFHPDVTERTLTIDPDILRLTDLPVGGVATFQARVRNDHHCGVRITRIATSCGCSDFSAEPKHIPPGGYATIHGGIRAKARPGLVSIKATLHFQADDGTHARRDLLVSGLFVAPVDISPTEIVLSPTVGARSPARTSVKVRNTSGSSLSLRFTAGEGITLDPASCELKADSITRLTASCGSLGRNLRGRLLVTTAQNQIIATVPYVITPDHGAKPGTEVLILGQLRRERDELTSTHPPVIEFEGTRVGEFDVKVVDFPHPLSNPTIVRTTGSTRLQFGLSSDWANLRIHGPVVVELRNRSAPEERVEFSIPVLGHMAKVD